MSVKFDQQVDKLDNAGWLSILFPLFPDEIAEHLKDFDRRQPFANDLLFESTVIVG